MEALIKQVAEDCVSATLGHEGGYVNNKHDSGGETNWGITQKTLNSAARRGQASIGGKYRCRKVADLTPKIAMEIYIGEYFTPIAADRVYSACRAHVSHNAALLLTKFYFDCAVNHGTGTAVKILQRALNLANRRATLWADLAVDGGYGGKTQKALTSCLKQRGRGAPALLSIMLALRAGLFSAISKKQAKNEEFIVGWLRRLESFYGEKFAVFGKK